ncbi:hypothetical protein Rhopal_006860-T1 [Rhodotorula paludigena]|uniref:Uncharacterized protein n=1 Tax=Rhodotorula paludigena TaxID=86838 RepID=A0AAV5GXN3_9BASI|nr:hypothetical protein Rhopal_006860-T1 [Rhodotorula paludigena]
MTTIPSRLAREAPHTAPEIVQLYALNVPAYAIRAKVREEYERNRAVDDIKALDVLLLKGYQDLQETLNCWKMDSHVLRWFSKEERLMLSLYPCATRKHQLPARPDTFLESFYLSRDDSKEVQPTA